MIPQLHHKARLDAWLAGDLGLAPTDAAFPAAVRRRQLELLNETLACCRAGSAFWRERLRHCPDRLADLDELRLLPLLTVEDLRTHGAALCCMPQGEFARVTTIQEAGVVEMRTSGASGPPKRLWFTAQDLAETVRFFTVGMAHIVPPGSELLTLMPGERPGTVGDLLSRAMERLRVPCRQVGLLHDPEAVARLLEREAIGCVVALPWQALALARWMSARTSRGPLRVLLSGDAAPAWMAREIARRLHGEVYLHWGMTETCLGGAVECHAHDGLHIRALDLWLETVHPVTGEALPPGEPGELAVTTLARRGMPLIRYRTGDLARVTPGPCACGSLLPRLENPSRRLGDAIALRTGEAVPGALLDEAVLMDESVLACELRLERAPDHDILHVRGVAAPGNPRPQALEVGLWARLSGIPAIQHACEHNLLRLAPVWLSPDEAPALLRQLPPKRHLRVVETQRDMP